MKARELTPEQEATIDQRLDQAAVFMQDVLDDPAILTDIPDGSVLRFSNVTIGSVDFRLTAYADSNASHNWTARVTGPAEWAAEGRKPFSATLNGAGGKWGSPLLYLEHGSTADEALAALEEKLRDSRGRFESQGNLRRKSA
ncbi:MAG: hypothetical protein M3Z20_02845 [Chloroflexota bacterium]|nr:hypothetical protein [Chloroflexota bacterium]